MTSEEQKEISAVVAAGFRRLSEGRLVNRGALQRLARVVVDTDEELASEEVWGWVWDLKRDMR